MHRSSRRGFTIVELLVVISIIAVLVSFLLPAMSKTRSVTRQVMCASRIGQWQVAIRTYAIDFKDFLPRRNPLTVSNNFPDIYGIEVINQLTPYVGSVSTIAFCPDGYIPETGRATWLAGGSGEYAYFGSLDPIASFFPSGNSPLPPKRASASTDKKTGRPNVLVADNCRFYAGGVPVFTTHPDRSRGAVHYVWTGIPMDVSVPNGLNVGLMDGAVRWTPWVMIKQSTYYNCSPTVMYAWDY